MTDLPSNPIRSDPLPPDPLLSDPLPPDPLLSDPLLPDPLPPDPAAYDSPRAAQARARGLATPYIGGGRDPDPESGRREERFYLRILLAMVVLIVLSGFVLGAIAKLVGG